MMNLNFGNPSLTELSSSDTKDRNNWAEATDWLHQHLTIYRRVLSNPTAA